MKKYGLLAVCVVLLAGAVAWLRRVKTPESAASSSQAAPVRPSAFDERLPSPQPIIETEPTKTPVSDSAPSSDKRVIRELTGSDWAVVAAIYKDYEAAERRARTLGDGSPFKPTVFPEEGKGSKYMVVLDSGLTHGKAMQVRDRAVSSGLPPDTYVTRLSPRE